MEENDTPSDRIIARLRAARRRAERELAANTGEELLEKDFLTRASRVAPREIQEIEQLLMDHAARINAERFTTLNLQFVIVNHRLEVGSKYAVCLQPVLHLHHYTLSVDIGLHPNADMAMAEIPDVPHVT